MVLISTRGSEEILIDLNHVLDAGSSNPTDEVYTTVAIYEIIAIMFNMTHPRLQYERGLGASGLSLHPIVTTWNLITQQIYIKRE